MKVVSYNKVHKILKYYRDQMKASEKMYRDFAIKHEKHESLATTGHAAANTYEVAHGCFDEAMDRIKAEIKELDTTKKSK